MEVSHRHWEKSSKGHVWCGSNIIYAHARLTLITAEHCRADPEALLPLAALSTVPLPVCCLCWRRAPFVKS